MGFNAITLKEVVTRAANADPQEVVRLLWAVVHAVSLGAQDARCMAEVLLSLEDRFNGESAVSALQNPVRPVDLF